MTLPLLMIADDSESKQLMLEGFIRHSRWKVDLLRATTTEGAKKMIDRHPDIAFAFVDYEMPSENGPAVIRYLKEKNPAARIALISASDDDRSVSEAKAAGAETCVCTTNTEDVVFQSMGDVIEEWREIDPLRSCGASEGQGMDPTLPSRR